MTQNICLELYNVPRIHTTIKDIPSSTEVITYILGMNRPNTGPQPLEPPIPTELNDPRMPRLPTERGETLAGINPNPVDQNGVPVAVVTVQGLNNGTIQRESLPFTNYTRATPNTYTVLGARITMVHAFPTTTVADVVFTDPDKQLVTGFNRNDTNQPLARNIGLGLYELRKAGLGEIRYGMFKNPETAYAAFCFTQAGRLNMHTHAIGRSIHITDELLTNLFTQP